MEFHSKLLEKIPVTEDARSDDELVGKSFLTREYINFNLSGVKVSFSY